jgi:ribosomal protein L11 methylase PrmA
LQVVTEKECILNDEKRWGDLVRTQSWNTALLRANVPTTLDTSAMLEALQLMYPDVLLSEGSFDIVPVEERDWVSQVQSTWPPQRIGDLLVRFPWHADVVTGNIDPSIDLLDLTYSSMPTQIL